VVVPVVGGRPEPLHARYARRVMPEVRRRIIEGDLKIAHFFYAVTTHWIDEGPLRDIDPELRFLANFNTPDDLPHG
jgi:molybdopterin-guanine dinucleotide biosynthesis protein A